MSIKVPGVCKPIALCDPSYIPYSYMYHRTDSFANKDSTGVLSWDSEHPTLLSTWLMYWYGCGLPERPVQQWASSIQTIVEIHLCLLDLVTLRKKPTPWDNTTTLLSSAVAFMELWLIEPLDPSIQPPNNAYTIRNLSSGNYLTSRNGTSVILETPTGTPKLTSEGWTITPDPSGHHQSVYSFNIRIMHY
jgi:hypothetical protein